MQFRLFHIVSQRDGVRIAGKKWGWGSRVCVLIHGFGEGSYVWEDLVASLGSDFQSIAVDLRGHGDSGWDPAGIYDAQRHVDDVLKLCETIESNDIVLIGHSLGGEIAIRVAASQRVTLSGIVIVDFAPSLGQQGVQRVLSDFQDFHRPYLSAADYIAKLHEARPLVCPKLLARYADGALRWRGNGTASLKCDPALAIHRDPDERATSALWDIVKMIPFPSLVIRGAGSAVLSHENAQRMVRTMPNARLSVVRGAGHSVMADNPMEFGQAVQAFLLSLPERGQRHASANSS